MNDKAPVGNRTKSRLTLLAAAAILGASASVAGWLAYKAPAPQDPQPNLFPDVTAPASPKPLPTAPTAQTGTPDPFALVSCQVRQFDESPALALTFSQPLDRTQTLSGLLRVSDQGAIPVNESGEPTPPSAVRMGEEIDPSSGTPVKGNWVVGDNPRMAYFPFIQPLRGYTVDVSAKLAQAAGDPLGTDGQCELHTDAMPASYYFASRGVVLPPGQNGGLPVVTVNVPEVDVQFLRIEPAQLPRFFENVLGVRRPVAATDTEADSTDDSDADENGSDGDWRYSGNRSLQGSMGLWDLDRLKSLSTSVYSGRFVADDRPNRRNVTFLPVEDIAELKQPGIYVAVMSQPGRFVYESQVTYFYVSDIGLHSRRHPDGIDAYATSLAQGRAIAGVDMELLDATGRSLASASTDDQGRATFEGRFEAARLVTARRGQEFTVVALQQPALDLSEFDVGGLPASSNRLFVYAGRDLYRPGETFQLSVLARNPDGRALPASPLTATLKRPDGRVVRTSTWQAQDGLPGYTRAPARPTPPGNSRWKNFCPNA
jgi:uncharacterized protein YfaS (alpha-2-macroglobulin family)